MNRYILELKNFHIDVPFTGFVHDASHLYWTIKDTTTGEYTNVYHGGAEGNNGGPTDKAYFVDTDALGVVKDNKSIQVLEINSKAELETIRNVISSTGNEINNLNENYGIITDNSNSVAYLLGRANGGYGVIVHLSGFNGNAMFIVPNQDGTTTKYTTFIDGNDNQALYETSSNGYTTVTLSNVDGSTTTIISNSDGYNFDSFGVSDVAEVAYIELPNDIFTKVA